MTAYCWSVKLEISSNNLLLFVSKALLIFWYHACIGCDKNVDFITGNAHVSANIPLNYIL